ncbi:hypothetical protein [Longitalea arenae]|uniref:hypothetical protein n=1 Tax=Longitalea arenae TaxID=2812558 RepID=UPI0019678D11|nr:hypothetical protein [Longitalea arenae]
MKSRRIQRRLFNLFAFACLAFALYLVAFVKEEPLQQADAGTSHISQVAHKAQAAASH